MTTLKLRSYFYVFVESDTDHSDPTSVSKRRKPGRPKKYCNPGKSAGNTGKGGNSVSGSGPEESNRQRFSNDPIIIHLVIRCTMVAKRTKRLAQMGRENGVGVNIDYSISDQFSIVHHMENHFQWFCSTNHLRNIVNVETYKSLFDVIEWKRMLNLHAV